MVDRRRGKPTSGPPVRPVAEPGNHRFIRWRELVGGKLLTPDPGDGLSLEPAGFAGEQATTVEAEADLAFRVGVGGFEQAFPDLDLNSQFLEQFATEAVGEVFVGVSFAAGKLPEPGEVGVGGALGEEEAAVAEEEAGGDVDPGEGVGGRGRGQRPMLR